MPSSGFTAEPLGVEPLGHRASDHVRLVLSDLRVPDEQRLGDVGASDRAATAMLSRMLPQSEA